MLDNDSKDLFDIYISAQISGDITELEKYRECVANQYFRNDYIPNDEVEFIDSGAFTGDTILHATKKLNISRYIAIEPEKDNISKIKKRLESTPLNIDVDIVEAGVYNETKRLLIDPAGSSTRISDQGNVSISVITLDSLIDRLNPQKTLFIKMDIEGAEQLALQGAEKLIKLKKPYMAVCVYHCTDDLIKIPQYIESIMPKEYRYGLGYYGNNYRELVLYAAPK